MNTSRPTNDKLFIFDVNPSNDDVTKELVIGNFSRVVKNLSDYQNVVFLSHSNLSLMKKLIEDIGIKNGFVISDNGSRIYDIDKGTIVYENFINKSDVLAGLHLGIMENCLVLLSGSNKEYAYSANIMSALTLSKKHYAALPWTNDYSQIEKFINSTMIHSLLFFQRTKEMIVESLKHIYPVYRDWNFNLHQGQSSYFTLTDNKSSKYSALLKLIEHLKIKTFDNVYYYAINTITERCLKSFKNKLIFQDIALASKYYADIEDQAKVDDVIDNIKNIISDSFEVKLTTKQILYDTKKIKKLHK